MGTSPLPTSSSGGKNCVLIDFGLSLVSSDIEARGVDLHVFFQTLESTTGILMRFFKEPSPRGTARSSPGSPRSSPASRRLNTGGATCEALVVTSNPHKAEEVAAFFEGELGDRAREPRCPEFRHLGRRGDCKGEGAVCL